MAGRAFSGEARGSPAFLGRPVLASRPAGPGQGSAGPAQAGLALPRPAGRTGRPEKRGRGGAKSTPSRKWPPGACLSRLGRSGGGQKIKNGENRKL